MEINPFMSKKIFLQYRNCIFSDALFLIFFFGLIFFSCSKKNQNINSVHENNSVQKKEVLKIATEFGYPPFEYLDHDGKTLIGFDVDMWNEICRRLDMTPVYEDVQWSGIFSALESKRFDCIISAVTITEERKEKFLITTPYVQNAECFIVKADSKNQNAPFSENSRLINSPDKLNGLRVAYQAETVSDVYVSELLKNGISFEVFEYDKLMNAFDDLKYDRVDVVVAESVAAKNLVKINPDVYRIDFTGEPDAYFGILVNKDNTKLFELIQSALDEMNADGTMKSFEDKWLK